MRFRFPTSTIMFFAAILGGPVPSIAHAASIVETVEGYAISDTEVAASPRPCHMVRSFKDAKDSHSSKGLFFAQGADGKLVVNMVFTKWSLGSGTVPKVRFQVDDQAHAPLWGWQSSGSNLSAAFADTLAPRLGEGGRIVVGLQDGSVDFDLTGFRPAFEALQRCNRTARPHMYPADPAMTTVTQGGGTDGAGRKQDSATPPDAATPAPASWSDKHATVYTLSRYMRWAIETCGNTATARQKQMIDSTIHVLRFDTAAIEPALGKKFGSTRTQDCPSVDVFERHIALVNSANIEKQFTEMDEALRRDFRSIIAAAAAAAEPPPVEAEPETAPDQAPDQAPDAPAATPEELRAIAYLGGLILQDGIERCDVATTARQRAAIADKVAALRPEMQDIDAPAREIAAKERCPDADDQAARDVLQAFVDTAPEIFAADLNEKMGGRTLAGIRGILAQARPAAAKPGHPRAATYLYGLVLRDVIAGCDIRTTGRQRADFEAKMASLRPDLAALEPALLEQKGAFTGCPPAERIADMEAALPVFLDRSPEDFAAEMDRRSKARRAN